MLITAKRLYLVLCGLVVLSLAALGASAYGAMQVLQKKSTDVHDARLKSLALEERQNRLRKAKADIAKYQELAQIAKGIVPQDKDQARTIRELTNLAEANGIKLGAITFPSSSLGSPAAKKSDSQLKAVPKIAGTFVMTIEVRSDTQTLIPYKNFTAFLEALEQNRRTALVTGITITPDAINPNNIQFSLTIEEYIKP